jgi:hypothetical protein
MKRTSPKVYTHKPETNVPAARRAWINFAERGPIVAMTLTDGQWVCDRGNGPTETLPYDMTRTKIAAERLRERQRINQAIVDEMQIAPLS